MGWYRQGTTSVANGSTAVTGTLTAWTSQVKAEDRITFDGGGKWYEVASVESNTALTLATPFGEATVTDGAYAIDRSGRGWSIVSDLAARVAALLAMFPVLGGAADALKWFRANATGDAFEFTAATPATVNVGSTTTGAPGSSASVANSGTSSDAVLDFTIPRGDTGEQGPPGADWKSAWLPATGYVARDVVKHNGSSYICTSGHTSGATTEPGVGVDWATVWDLFVEKGNTGDPGPTGVNWITGGWLTATAYAARDAVQHNGSSYICISGHTSGATTEPGVGVDWATVWDVLAEKGTGDLLSTNNLSDVSNPSAARLNLGVAPGDPQGRLTLSTGVPVMTSTVADASVIRYTEFTGRLVPLFDGTRWKMYDMGGELSHALSDTTKSPAAASPGNVYDLYVWDDAGTLRCTRSPAWSSILARGSGPGTAERARVEGRMVNAYDITNGPLAQRGTYVGTIYVSGDGNVDWILGGSNTLAILGLFNGYNRRLVSAEVFEPTTSWSYPTQTWRRMNNNANMQIWMVRGDDDDIIDSSAVQAMTSSSTPACGIGVDWSSGEPNGLFAFGAAGGAYGTITSRYVGNPGIGFRTLSALEYGNTGATFYGRSATGAWRCGLSASMWA